MEAPAATALEITEVPVGLIDPNPWNPNVQSDVVARATRESLERYGFVEPILVRPHPSQEGRFEIVNGEHREKEAVALGYETVPCVVAALTDEEAKKLTVVLNETTGDADVVLLGQLLSGLSHLDDFKTALPYTDAELEHLLSIGNEDWDQFARGETAPPEPPPVADPDLEVVLSFSTRRLHDQFRKWLAILEKEYGAGSVTDVVFEAVRRAALAANQDK